MRLLFPAALVCLLANPLPSGAQVRAKAPFQAKQTEAAGRSTAAGVSPASRWPLGRAREFALPPLSAAQEASVGATSGGVQRVGMHRTLPDGVLANGIWEQAPDGSRLWRMALRSPDAAAIRLHLTGFDAGAGRVWIQAEGQTGGPYSGRGPFGTGEFWSDVLFTDSVTIEYEPAAAFADSFIPFRVDSLSHQVAAAQAASPAGKKRYDAAGVPDPAAPCNLDAACYPEWHDSAGMVAGLLLERDGAEYACSGALLATRHNSGIPYLLTAAHCIGSEAEARTLQVFWTYQTSYCGGPLPDRRDSLRSSPGAHLLASGNITEGDFSLLLLRDVPDGVWFAGWDPGNPPQGSAVTGIHHPRGSYKRVSFGRRVGDASADVDGRPAPWDRYFQVVWDRGVTEPGSSGSPLFSGPGVVAGVLSYGPVSDTTLCDAAARTSDGYGRFSAAYPFLRSYLEELPSSAVVPAPAELKWSGTNGVLAQAAARDILLTTLAAGSVEFKVRPDAPWVHVSATSGEVSSSSSATLQVSVDPRYLAAPGHYRATVTITAGAAGPQFLNITVEMKSVRSDVSVLLSPNPVYEQPDETSGAPWHFRITVKEKAGAATRLTAIKINGVDYSSKLAGWFGGTRLAASGSLEAALSASGRFPAGDQYFELWGVDDESGESWYRSATVRFVPAFR